MFNKVKPLYLLIVLTFILAACQPTDTPEPVVETMVVTEAVEATPVEVIQVVTPTPEPAGSRTFVVCLDQEPENINFVNIFWESRFPVQEAIFDGPIDYNSFAFQPVILEKLPSLADGDATLTTVTVSEGDIVVDANSNLVTLDPTADPPIMLAPPGGGDPVQYQGGDFEMEQLSATFRLLPGLLWSDGTPLTAVDSVYAFKMQPNYLGENWLADRTATYEVLDDLTIEWKGVPGFREGNYSTFIVGPVPEHIWGQYSPTELYDSEEFSRLPVGWGPYMVEEWIEGESITLSKNPNYFRADEGLPNFDNVIYRFTGENTNANIAALLAGECDIISAPLDDQIELLLELHQTGKLNATFTTGTVWEHIDFGIQHVDYDDGYQPGVDRPDFFSDVRTRQAFAMCMDRQALVDTIFYGQSLVPDSYVPPQHPLHNPDVKHYDFDVAAGSALLEQVGWTDDDGDPETPRVAQGVPNVPDGTSLVVAYETTSSQIRQQVTPIIQDSLGQCGIKTNIKLYPSSDFFSPGPENKIFGRRYDLTQYAFSVETMPPCEYYHSSAAVGPAGTSWISIQDGIERTYSENGWTGGWNQMGFANEDYDRACGKALSSFPGQPEHELAHQEAQRIFSEQLPSVPLFLRIKVTATRPDMCGVIMDPSTFTAFWNIEEFDYGEGCQE
jgi:peptide/nickel transport system substrate-binding protein